MTLRRSAPKHVPGREARSAARGPVRALALAGVLAGVLAAAPAPAQPARANEPERAQVQRPPGRGEPPFVMLMSEEMDAPIARSQHPVKALTIEQSARLGRARALRVAGQLAPARDSLARLLVTVPHHPDVLTELALVHAAKRDWRAVEQLARAERMAMRDSLVLVAEFAEALERTNHPRDAAQVVLEGWIVAPELAEWAGGTLRRLAADEPPVSALLRQHAAARPNRPDMVRMAARLEWDHGDPRSALALLAGAERPDGTPLRWVVAEEMLGARGTPDSAAAVEVLLDLAADARRNEAHRLAAARRVISVAQRSRTEPATAPRVSRALADVPPGRWGGSLVIAVARGLRAAGLRDDARALLAAAGDGGRADPQLALERALEELRADTDEKTLGAFAAHASSSPDAGFRYAEALFFAGRPDSALTWYERSSRDAGAANTGAALERMYLIEDADPRDALPAFGRLAWQEWREEPKAALGIADSLYGTLPRTALWAHAAITLARLREHTGAGKEALEPLLALADSLPEDRLAPLARQRAGDVLRQWYGDDRRALEQYEECLARYPRAWNAPEVRRQVQDLRREKRF